MKKYLMTLGLMLGMLSLTSCQKDAVDNSLEIENGGKITHTFTMGGEWNNGTRSYYEEGEGVKLTGEEAITVYYGDAYYKANSEDTKSKLKTTKGTPEGNFEYSFSHDAISGAEAYDYYFIMPNTTTNNSQSKGHRPLVYLNTIQTPSATTFDPAQDYLLGRPILNQSSALTDATVYFKRIFAPLRMTIKNDGLLEAGEKILYTTISQSTPCTQKTGLTGNAYIMFSDGDNSPTKSDAYEHAVIRNFSSSGVGNKVTAFYPNGLEADASGNFPIWFIINPENYYTGDPTSISGDMTVTIVTDKRMVSRTVTLASPMNFASDKLNKFSITFAENADIVSGEAVTTVFANVASLDELTGWSFENCSINKNALEVAKNVNGRINIPARAGYSVKKIVVLPSLYHPNNSTANTISLYSGDEKVGEAYEFNAQRMLTDNSNMYGYLVVDVPATTQSNIALVRESNGTEGVISSIRAITVIYEKSDTPQAAVELTNAEKTSLTFNVALTNANKYYYLLQAAADAAPTADDVVANGEEGTNAELTISGLNEDTAYTLYLVPAKDSKNGPLVSVDAKTKSSAIDYYEKYTKDGSVTIGNHTFTKETWGEATLVSTDELSSANLTNGGIVFVEKGNNEFSLGSNTKLQKDLTIIGRYSNQQPVLNTKKLQLKGGCKYYFTNLKMSCGEYTENFITTEAGTNTNPIDYLAFTDCTLEPCKHAISVNKYSIKDCIIDNCIIKLNSGMGIYIITNNDNVDFQKGTESIEINNCVIYSSAEVPAYLIGAGTADRNMPNATILIKNNTIYNFYRNPYFNLYNIKSFDIQYNVVYTSDTESDKSFVRVINDNSDYNTGTYTISNNYGYTAGKKFNTNYPGSSSNPKCAVDDKTTKENNTFVSGGEDGKPIKNANVTTGYLPIDTSVVTNGAGASYKTKSWNAWE